MGRRNLLFLILILLGNALFSQIRIEGIEYDDRIYADYIKSVKFHISGLFLSYPIIDLESGAPLTFRFDDLSGGVRTYSYTIIHCDADWQPSQLNEMEYLEGFAGEPISDYRFSFKTITNYTHYWVELPNRNLTWTKSGNYLLIVYEDEGERVPIITRRFMVVDPKVQIAPQMVRPADVSKSKTHQEIDFDVIHENLDIRTPMTEVQAVVMQNGRWNNAVTGLRPAFIRYDQLIFDHQDKVVFPSGKEFRFIDLRSFRTRSEAISLIERYDDRTEIVLYKEEKRFRKSYNFFEDINGKFIIETFDGNDNNLSSDYAYVLFSLYSPEPYYEYDVYIIGEMTNWKALPEFGMVYSESVNGYVAKPMLKQGVYNYVYAVVPKGDPDAVPDISEVEGDWQLTENEYTILIYYRPFGSRYDQLIGSRTFSSTPR